MWKSWKARLHRPVDGASLAAFRAAFGLLMVVQALGYLRPFEGANRVHRYFTGPSVHWDFPYQGLEWIRPPSEPFTTLLFALLALGGLGMALGLFYRTSAGVVFLSFAWFFLMDEAHYQNHYYLTFLLAALFLVMPAQAAFSLDRRGASEGSRAVGFWTVFLLRAQMFLVYFYGGIAKLNGDWLRGEPVRNWLFDLGSLEHLDPLLGFEGRMAVAAFLSREFFVVLLSYGGLAFDLSIGFLLLARRTRPLAFALAVLFHAFNSVYFTIGIFPPLAIAATTIFFAPDWPFRAAARIFGQSPRRPFPGPAEPSGAAVSGAIPAFAALFLAVQILLPVRHFLIPGVVHWTEEGHRFSWHMKLRDKKVVRFLVEAADASLGAADPVADLPAALRERAGRVGVYVNVDAAALDWASLPPRIVVEEPIVGRRWIAHPFSSPAADGAANPGRPPGPPWTETISLAAALAGLEARLASAEAAVGAGASRDLRLDLLAAVREARKAALRLPPAGSGPAARLASHRILTLLDRPVRYGPFREVIAEALRRTHPFALQGGRSQGPFFTSAESPPPGDGPDLDPAGRPAVHADLAGSPLAAWAGRPLLVPFRTPEYTAVRRAWNPLADLTPRQTVKMRSRPYMIRQYAGRIADFWEAAGGRRPAVFVTCEAALNDHPPRPLIDPRADLARAPLRRWGWNDWIVPFVGASDRPPSTP